MFFGYFANISHPCLCLFWIFCVTSAQHYGYPGEIYTFQKDVVEEDPTISLENPKILHQFRRNRPYALQPNDGTFMLDKEYNQLLLIRALDRDTPYDQSDMTAILRLNRYDRIYIHVNVLDINDNDPSFVTEDNVGYVLQSTGPGEEILTIRATDIDQGPNGTVYYSFAENNNETAAVFEINHYSGVIATTSEVPNKEVQHVYTMVVMASDGGTPSRIAQTNVSITVVDPEDLQVEFDDQILQIDIPESTAEGEVASVIQASRRYHGYRDMSTNLTYTIQQEGDPVLSIESDTKSSRGFLILQKELDYEDDTRNTITVVLVTATDGATTASVTINVSVTDITNEHTPVILLGVDNITVSEDVSFGSELVTFEGYDNDTGRDGEFRFSLESSPLNDFDFFEEDMGPRMTLKNTHYLDREYCAKYYVRITARDMGYPARFSVATLTIYVEDVNDNPPMLAAHSTPVIDKDTPVGSTVAVVMATDADEPHNGAPFRMWTPCDGTCPCDQNPSCDLFGFTEDGTVRTLTSYLVPGKYELPIVISDSGTPSLTATSTLTVMVKQPPVLPPPEDNSEFHYTIALIALTGICLMLIFGITWLSIKNAPKYINGVEVRKRTY